MRFGRKMTAAMRPEWGPHVYVPYEALKRTPNLNPNPNPTLTLTPALNITPTLSRPVPPSRRARERPASA